MGRRIQRINQLIKEEMSQLLLKEVEFPKDTLVTITRVETSADLKLAKIYISCLPTEKTQKIMDILGKSVYCLQGRLNKLLRIKVLPKIKFLEEKKTREAAEIEEILAKIEKDQRDV